MSGVTREQVLQEIAGFGVPLENLFLIGEDNDTLGVIAAWYPEIGLRSIHLENDDLAIACYNTLRAAGVRRFQSWEELGETQDREKWEGWDTCADYRRWQQAAESFRREGLVE
jgi:hypothetical protein